MLTDERQRRGADKKNTTTHHRQHSWSTDYSGYFLHLSRHLAVHNLNPSSLSDNTAEKLKLTSSQPCYILLSFAFSLSAFLLCAQYSQIRSHALRHALQRSLWGVKPTLGLRSQLFVNLTPRLFGCAALAPKRKSNPGTIKNSQRPSFHPRCWLPPALSLAATSQPYPLLQPASPMTRKEQSSVSPFHPS